MLIKLKSFEFWLYGLISAIIGGSTTAIAAKIVLPNSIIDFNDMWKLALTSGFVNAVFYLKQSPLPKLSTGETEILTQKDYANEKITTDSNSPSSNPSI